MLAAPALDIQTQAFCLDAALSTERLSRMARLYLALGGRNRELGDNLASARIALFGHLGALLAKRTAPVPRCGLDFLSISLNEGESGELEAFIEVRGYTWAELHFMHAMDKTTRRYKAVRDTLRSVYLSTPSCTILDLTETWEWEDLFQQVSDGDEQEKDAALNDASDSLRNVVEHIHGFYPKNRRIKPKTPAALRRAAHGLRLTRKQREWFHLAFGLLENAPRARRILRKHSVCISEGSGLDTAFIFTWDKQSVLMQHIEEYLNEDYNEFGAPAFSLKLTDMRSLERVVFVAWFLRRMYSFFEATTEVWQCRKTVSVK